MKEATDDLWSCPSHRGLSQHLKLVLCFIRCWDTQFKWLNFNYLYCLQKTNVSSSLLNLYPFEIQPSIFELRKGDVFAIEIVFKPPDVKHYEQDIIIACDNCTTIEFKLIGEGELAEIEYLPQEDDPANPSQENIVAFDDFKDKLSSKIIRFPALNPSVYTRKRFAIKNKS